MTNTLEPPYVHEPDETDPLWSPLFEEVWHDVSFKMIAGHRLILEHDKRIEHGRWYFQIAVTRPDTYTGEMGEGRGGKAYLNPDMCRSELVQIAFGLLKGYWLHETHEGFLYRGKQIFGPHIDVLAHYEIADRTEFRRG